MSNTGKIFIACCFIPLLMNCKSDGVKDQRFHFTLMDASETNISFDNKITESDSINVFTNEYMYNGSGVGIGDFNNDGLPDVFFCGSMVSSRLYINKGSLQFEDVTEKAGLLTNKWCTGVSIVDVNNDGFDDIYVCASHSHDGNKRANQLFINDGKLHFTDEAAAYGLADTGYATEAAWLDYDGDGDLDMYLLNHQLYSHTANNLQPKDTSGNAVTADKLYRNNGNLPGHAHPYFQDVSKEAGIKEDGYGLGVVVTDVNADGWPDIYVANDYIANDLLWLNNQNGTFSNVISTSLRHQSYNSMGVDAADINNDLLPDLMVVDMQPETNERKRMMSGITNQEKFDMQERFGYEPSYVRNMLQLNNGNRKLNNRTIPFYSEIGQLAGVFETDWSWSVLMADFDNDGWKDIHITNGLGKDVTNSDYTSFANEQVHTSNYTFNANEKPIEKKDVSELRKGIDKYGSVAMQNYFLRNNGDLTFTDVSTLAENAVPSISHGAAYADLDNDGDLDLLVNNMNQAAFVWRNDIRKSITDSTNNFLGVQLKGSTGNGSGLGCKLTLFSKGTAQSLEQSPVRGFSSSVDSRLHFGVGNIAMIDSLKIAWPNGKIEVVPNLAANQYIKVNEAEAKDSDTEKLQVAQSEMFADVSDQYDLSFIHKETQNFDFGSHQPLSQKYSQLGPCLATGDLNGDGLEDIFIGGAANQSGKICIQTPAGRFKSTDLVPGLKTWEDVGAILFDADGDKDLDLLITGGSQEYQVPAYNQPRLFVNDGKANFTPDPNALPAITAITKAVCVSDIDADGDLDIFIGGRIEPHMYPQSPRSYILQNDHGRFTDITKENCPSLEFAGLVTDAIFADFNNDRQQDLIICGEWMPVRFFANTNGRFNEVTGQTGLNNMNGQWRSLQVADLDMDGDLDVVAGNLGLNNKYHVAPEKPLKLYAGDFDGNNITDLISAYYIKNSEGTYDLFPALDRTQLAFQMPSVKKKYLLNSNYAKENMSALLAGFQTNNLLEKSCETAATVWLENLGNGQFKQHLLPVETQFAPVNSIVVDDVDGDGHPDILLAGNEYQADAATGRYDASFGVLLKGDGKGHFAYVKNVQTGFTIDGDVKNMKLLTLGNKKKILLAAVNNDKLKCFGKVGKG